MNGTRSRFPVDYCAEAVVADSNGLETILSKTMLFHAQGQGEVNVGESKC